MSNQPSKNKASEEAYFRETDKIFRSIGMTDLFPRSFRPTSYLLLLRKINRLLGETKSFHTKIDSRMAACWSKSRSIPENATIRKEYVKCKKPNCRRKQHGPYYYAYWRDSKTKKLRKKYIGRYYFTPDEPKPEEVAKDMIGELPLWEFDSLLK